jgi:hypothetical protein
MHDDNQETPAQAYHRSLWFSRKFGKKSWA